jgi:hypothetical protein
LREEKEEKEEKEKIEKRKRREEEERWPALFLTSPCSLLCVVFGYVVNPNSLVLDFLFLLCLL